MAAFVTLRALPLLATRQQCVLPNAVASKMRLQYVAVTLLWCLLIPESSAQLVVSGNENKVDLTSGAPRIVPTSKHDSVSIIDFSTFPPKAQHIDNVANTVIGPPSNIAITPDHSLALIANSIKLDPSNATNWLPSSEIHVMDLTSQPPRVIDEVRAGEQPSGLSITRDGKLALVANRAAGSVSMLSINGKQVRLVETVTVCKPEESVSDVAISPKGGLVLATAQKGSFVAVLRLNNGHLESTPQKISAYGQPYRCVITPDGELGITAGQGFGNGIDHDAVTIIDLTAKPMRTIQHITIGAVPESLEISPDGRLLAVVVMNGSNLAADNPSHTSGGALEILVRRGKGFQKAATLPVGPIPEGVAFTSDGRHLVVQCHSVQELWIFEVAGEKVTDTGERIKVPGMPSSLRAAP